MAQPHWYLKDPKRAHTPLVMRYLYQRYRIKFYPGITIRSDDWDQDSERVRRSARNYQTINAILSRVSSEAERLVLDSMLSGSLITPAELKRALVALTKGKRKEVLTAADFIASEIELRKYSPSYSERTIQKYSTLLKKVREYDRKRQVHDVTVEWIIGFIGWMDRSGLSQNTVAKYVKTLKVFLNVAVEQDLIPAKVPSSTRISVQEKRQEKRYLSLTELERIRKVPLQSGALDNARTLFLLLTYTGQRYSDIEALLKADVLTNEGKDYVKIMQAKTGAVIHIPLHQVAKDMLMRQPHPISNVKLNKYIKEVAGMAGIYDPDAITVHTARRSAATNMYLMGISSRLICAITGHKSERMLLRYIQADSLESAIAVGAKWF